jgi:hypothetical protein
MQFGEKDDTWNEVVFMEPEEFDHYENNKKLKAKLDEADEEDELEDEDSEEESEDNNEE